MDRSLSRSRSFDPRRIIEGLRGLARSIAASRWLRDSSYSFWIARYDRLSERDRALIRERIASFSDPPLFSVIVHHGGAPPGALPSSLESVFAQIYPHWELILCFDGSARPRVEEALGDRGKDPRVRQASCAQALEETKGGFVALLEASDELSEHALYMIAEELQAHPESDLVYSDHDRIDPRGRRCDPWFKSEWNPDLLLSQDCIGHLAVFRASVLAGLGAFRERCEGEG
ncbi:MAG: glycosyltransferase, partial [Vicinamibacteria bacterium]